MLDEAIDKLHAWTEETVRRWTQLLAISSAQLRGLIRVCLPRQITQHLGQYPR